MNALFFDTPIQNGTGKSKQKGHKMRGYFAAFEGIDYAGKRTQLHRIKQWLESEGYMVRWGYEPNDRESPIGKLIRAMLSGEVPPPDPFEFQRMFVIDRAQDVFCFIKPAIESGAVALWERYALSTIAYGMLSGRPAEDFIKLHEDVLGLSMLWLWPDATFLIDISAEEALRRMAKIKAVPQHFEKLKYLKRIGQNYLRLTRLSTLDGRIFVVDGERSEEEIFAEIRDILKPRLPGRA